MHIKTYKPQLLFVFCNATLASTINKYFERKDYNIDITYNCKDALTKIMSNKYELLMLEKPKIEDHCTELIRTVRSSDNYIPIIVLDEKDSDSTNIYRSGANLTHYKPLNPRLLEVQIEQLIQYRRGKYKIKMLDIEINLKTREVRRNRKKVKLTKQEFNLLLLLINAEGHIIHKSKIISNIMDYNKYVQNGAVDTLICRTRNKLAEYGERKIIETVIGSGYKISNMYQKSCKFT
jgi:DNA-binding response OmpR family regulator